MLSMMDTFAINGVRVGEKIIAHNVTMTIEEKVPGSIKTLVPRSDRDCIDSLIIIGTIDARDFKYTVDSLPSLTRLDLSGAVIVSYSGTEGTIFEQRTYPANEIPQGGCSNLTSIVFPPSITSIGENAFYRLTSINIPSSVNNIGAYAFGDCQNLTSINIPSGVKSIKNGTFYSCRGLTSIDIPSSVTSIDSSAFQESGLTSIKIPNSVNSIGYLTFYGCFSLTSVTIPASVKSIGSSAFLGDLLTSIYALPVKPVPIDTYVFGGVNLSLCTLYVPAGSKSYYQAADYWKDFANIVEINSKAPAIDSASISLYPTTVTDNFSVIGLEGTSLIKLIDVNGRVMLSTNVTKSGNISVGTLPKGLYMVKIITNNGTIERKLLKN